MSRRNYEAGRAWMRVEDAAACYEVEVECFREVVAAGLVDVNRDAGVERRYDRIFATCMKARGYSQKTS